MGYTHYWRLPANVVIRLAVHKIDGDFMRCEPPIKAPGITQCVVVDQTQRNHAWWCPAHKQGNQCGDCRACWDRDELIVTYPLH